MAEMPAPRRTGPTGRCEKLIRGLFAMPKAKPEIMIAMSSEARVVGMSYARAMGSEEASMRMKCIDQMPVPMATAPPESQRRRDDAPFGRQIKSN
jgi:hypothetical protein